MNFESLNYDSPEYYSSSPYQFRMSEESYQNSLQKLIAKKESDEVIMKEIQDGSNIYQKTSENVTTLSLAIYNRLENVVDKILSIYQKDVETLSEYGWDCWNSTVLIAFGTNQIARIANKLPSNLPSRQELPDKKIFILCKENNENPVDVKILIQEDEADAKIALEIIDSLYDNGTVDILYKSHKGNSVLHMAAYEGYLNVIEAFTKFGEEFDCSNNKNITPFGYACIANQLALVKSLHKKYKIELLDYLLAHKEIVFEMAAKNNWDLFEYLINEILKFSDEDHLQSVFKMKTDFHELNLLFIAVLNGHFDFVRKCLNYNPDVSEVNQYGENLLHFVIKNTNGKEFAAMLIKEYPILITTEDNCQMTPLHFLATSGWFEEFLELYQKYPDLKLNFHSNKENFEHIMMACINNDHFDIAIFILENHKNSFESRELISNLLVAAVVRPNSIKFIQHLQKLKNFDIILANASGNYALLEALKAGNLNNFQYLLSSSEIMDYNEIVDSSDNSNLLYYAIYRKPNCTDYEDQDETEINFQIFIDLLSKRVNPTHINKTGQTLLHRAVLLNMPKIAEVLLDIGLKADTPDANGKTPLHHVFSVTMLKVLMEKTPSTALNVQDKNGQTPVFDVMSQCKPNCPNFDLLQEILSYKPDLTIQDKNGFTYLHLASNQDCAQLLIKHGMDVNILCKYGENVLFKSMGINSIGLGSFPELGRYYLRCTDADPYIVNNNGVSILGCNVGHSVDYKEAFKGHSDIFHELLRKFHNGIDSNGNRILMTSLEKNDDFSLTLQLLKFDDIDVKCKNIDNSNLLHRINFGNSKNAPMIARLMIEKGVDINESNDMGKTPLILSVEVSDIEKAIFLMNQPNIQLNYQDINGNTALHYAATSQCIKLMCALLISGADPKVRNNDHKSFFDRLNYFNNSLFNFYDNRH